MGRREVEDAIEFLLTVLDAMDPDPDLEAGADDERSLGWATDGSQGSNDDLELDLAEWGIADWDGLWEQEAVPVSGL